MVSDIVVYGMLLGLAVSLWCYVYYIATDSGLNPCHEQRERNRKRRRGRRMWADQQWLAHFSFVERRASDKAVAVKLVDRTGGPVRAVLSSTALALTMT